MISYLPEAEDLFGPSYMYNGSRTELIFPCDNYLCIGRSWKLYVNIETGLYHCQRCEKSGHVKPPDRAKLRAPGKKVKLTLADIFAVPVRAGSAAYSYLKHKRGLSDREILYWDFRESPLNSWQGGVVIPLRDPNHPGFLVRVFDRDASKRWSRTDNYYNSPGFERRSTVFNIAQAENYSELIICEGVFSAVACGLNVVSTLGKDVTPNQFDRLMALKNVKEYIICFDGDLPGREKSLEVAKKIYGMGRRVSVVILPYGKDPHDMKDSIQDYIRSRVPISDFSLMELSSQIVRLRDEFVKQAYLKAI